MKRLSAVLLIVLLIPVFFSVMFAQTSTTPIPSGGETGIEGTITISPTHGGPTRIGVSNSKPLAGADFVVQNEKGDSVASFKTDDQGHFRVTLSPGHYKVSRKTNQKVGFFGPFEAGVSPGQITKVEWQCDSGMR